MPNTPTVAEAGVPGYAVTGWYGVIAPGGTPRSAVDRLNGEMVKFLNSPEARTRLLAMGMEPIANTPDQMAAHLTAELAKWARVAKLAKLSQRSVF
jgi:tripartite-type tricarboxylate transporter receptor subunit TctC